MTDEEAEAKPERYTQEDSTYYEKALARLQELEDKIESGKMIELPCKPNDIVYFVTDVDDGNDIYFAIKNGVVDCFNIETGCKECLVRYDGGLTYWHSFLDFGKEVFTDKSQAEARLKELQGEKEYG